MDPVKIAQTLDTRLADLQQALDPAARETERRRLLADFEEGGKYYYAPQQEKDKAASKVAATQNDRASRALFAVGRLTIDTEEVLQDFIAAAKEPPTALAEWQRAHDGESYSPDAKVTGELLVRIAEEQVIARLDRELHDALPAEVLARYDRAVETLDGATVRYIERVYGSGWSGPATSDPQQVTAATRLRRRINEVREGRVPQEFRQLQQTLAKAKRLMQQAQDIHGVIPRNPDHLSVGA